MVSTVFVKSVEIANRKESANKIWQILIYAGSAAGLTNRELSSTNIRTGTFQTCARTASQCMSTTLTQKPLLGY